MIGTRMRRRKLLRSKDYKYGSWAGNPEGNEYDPERCKQEVWGERTMIGYQ